jgi:hypothetical protein
MSTERPLLMLVERYLRTTGMSATTFGRAAVRDPRLVHDLRRGRTPGPRMRSHVEHFMNMSQELPR